MAYKHTCPECGSDRIVTDARVMLNTQAFLRFCHEDTNDCCLNCGAEDIAELVETQVPDDEFSPSITELLSTMTDYLVEAHAEDAGELASAHGGDAPRQGLWPEGCSYCREIVRSLEALGDARRLAFLRGLYPVCEACDGKGYVHSTDSDGEPEVQRCDECRMFANDDQARMAETAGDA